MHPKPTFLHRDVIWFREDSIHWNQFDSHCFPGTPSGSEHDIDANICTDQIDILSMYLWIDWWLTEYLRNSVALCRSFVNLAPLTPTINKDLISLYSGSWRSVAFLLIAVNCIDGYLILSSVEIDVRKYASVSSHSH